MNRDALRVLNLEADAGDHEEIRHRAVSTGLSLAFERAANRAEFEAALKRGGVDLILADHCVPGYDGMAALDSARARLPGVPYLIVSDSIGEDRAAECLRRGASDFVHKDRLERLPAAILQALRKPAQPGRATEAEERFREIAESIRDVFWVCDAASGRALYVSPSYDDVWGRPPGGTAAGLGLWPQEVLEEDGPVLAEVRAKIAGAAPFEADYRIRRPDASVRWIHDRGFPAPGKEGGPPRMVGLAADTTDRKRLEAELLQAQKMELVGRLAGGIAHDFNNLLTIISGYVSMLIDKENLPPASVEALKRVFTASRHATGLVRQLLLFSRKRLPKREVVDLSAEVETMVGMLRRLLGETIVIDFEPVHESPRVCIDVGMIEQVLMNLAVNARDAMPRGGRLSIAVGLPAHGVRPPGDVPATAGQYACISVSDTGSGIPAAVLPRIFEPFFTTKDEGRGTGLGLATAQDIVRRHDGWIEVETHEGVGSVFRIHLPTVHGEVAAAPAPEPAPEQRRGKATVLLVEDEANVREFAAAVLQQDGYTLLQAKSGENAKEVWRWHSARIDLLLTDVVLPGDLSGPVLGALFQAEKPALKVILTTGYSRDTVGEFTKAGKPQFVLNKPYTPRSLLRAVHEALA
jgi:PAS domain S-box-containing protein